MRLALFFLAALAWGQEPLKDNLQLSSKGAGCAEAFTVAEQNIKDQKQEIQRLTTLLNWYQQQFFALQARQIEQQVAPTKPAPAKPEPPK